MMPISRLVLVLDIDDPLYGWLRLVPYVLWLGPFCFLHLVRYSSIKSSGRGSWREKCVGYGSPPVQDLVDIDTHTYLRVPAAMRVLVPQFTLSVLTPPICMS